MPAQRFLLFVSKAYSFEILRPLQAEIRARGGQAAWFVHQASDRHRLRDDELLLTTRQAVAEFAPLAVFVPGNWVADFFPGLKVQVFHGFGIEKAGHFRIRGFFDLYCTHGPASTRGFLQLRSAHPHFEVVETGWPKMDPLFQTSASTSTARPTVLYAPTFSPSLSSASALHAEIKKLSQQPHWQWLIKFHPKMDHAWIAAYQALQGANLRVCADTDILPLLQQAQVMVSDTSSVISEFLLLNKPVVSFNTKQPQGHTYDIHDAQQLGPSIEQALSSPLPAGAQQFIADMHPYQDGRSSARVIDACLAQLSHPASPRKKPLNLFRKLKVRWKMRHN